MSAQNPGPSQPARRPLKRAALALLGAVVVTGGLCLWAVLASPGEIRTAVAWYGSAAALVVGVAVAAAVHSRQLVRALRQERVTTERAHRDRMARTESEIRFLARETLPALAEELRRGTPAETVIARATLPGNDDLRELATRFAREVGRGERMRAAALLACANAAGRVQGLTTNMLADIRKLQLRDGQVDMADLMELDHQTAQAGRLADRIAVLTGARSGRRWTKPIKIESILRGAQGRISAFKRVRLNFTSSVSVAGSAAEGVMHALAEIMDNATSFSPPSSLAHVYVEEVQAGVVITVEDGGLVMDEAKLRRAEKAVSSTELDWLALSGTRVGLAVVGALARKHNLTISFRPSSRGGTAVVMVIPHQLISKTHTPPAASQRDSATGAVPGPRRESRPAAVRSAPDPAPAAPQPAVRTSADRTTTADDTTTTAEATPSAVPADAASGGPAPAGSSEELLDGLPKRRRGQTLAAAEQRPAAASSAPRPARSPQESAARLSSFRKALGRPGTSDRTSPSPDSTLSARTEDDA